jgi:hypothetical protein
LPRRIILTGFAFSGKFGFFDVTKYNSFMQKKIKLNLVWLGLILLLLAGCNAEMATPTPAVSFVTPTPQPTGVAPTFTPVVVPTVGQSPVSAATATVTVAPQAKLLKAFQLHEKQNFSYTFEQTGELKANNSTTKLQSKGTGEVAQGNIRQSLELRQSGQTQKIEQIFSNQQFYQKIEYLKLWRKQANFLKFSTALPVSSFNQATEVKSLGQERIGNQTLEKFSFVLPGNLVLSNGIGLANLGLLNAADLGAVFGKGTAQNATVTVWLDEQGNISRYSSTAEFRERTSSLLVSGTFVITKVNPADASLTLPADLPKL